MQRTRRRRFILAAAAALAAAPLRAMAQAPGRGRPFRIGFGYRVIPKRAELYRQLLGELGWTHIRDYVFVDSGMPWGADTHEAAKRIVEQQPDIILVFTTAFALAVQRLTRTIPVVMYSSGYPVEAGVAHTLARPGMNVTGNTAYAGAAIWGKLLQLLVEATSGARRIGLIWDYLPPLFASEEIEFAMSELRTDARAMSLNITLAEIRRAPDVDVALASMQSQDVQALLVTSGPTIGSARDRILRFAIANRLPSIMDAHHVVPPDPAPLLAYGPPVHALTRQSFVYIDRILRGATPAELPIQLPSQFELVVNLKTARALQLEVPQSILARADRVVE